MGSVAGMTRDALNPIADSTSAAMSPNTPAASADAWDCSCGEKGITRKFCPECGAKRPAPAQTWDCSCGEKGITRNFCPECGAKRPAPIETWDCACGEKGITAKFCPECGTKRPEKTEEENANE